MNIYDILKSCLFLLDKDELVKEMDAIIPYYDAYKYAIDNNLTVDSVELENGQILTCTDSINNTKRAYDLQLEPIESANKIIVTLKFLINKVLKLISINYLPCVYKESIKVENGKFNVGELAKKFKSIKSVKDSNGERVANCRVWQKEIALKSGEYEIEYIYAINDYDYFEDVEDFLPCLTYSSVVDGVLGEYYLINGFYDEGDFFITRFESQMNAINGKTSEVRIKERLWQ
ncbi:MAG: hypothetical protein ACI4TX_01675 [Christensenellales bacterium]